MEKNNEVNKDNTIAFTRLDNSTIEEKVFDAPTGDVIVEKKQLSWWDKLKIPSLKWIPSSVDTLAAAEARMLKGVKTPYQQRMVNIGQDAKGRDIFINTLILGSGPPIVLVHGFSSGVGLWSCNLDELSKFYTVYAIDLLGFGRSSRVPFKGKTPEEGQKYFVDSIHAWAEKEKLEKFNLFGHSFGAYIAAHYALQNPERIEKLILCDPWGVPAKPKEDETQKPNLKWRVIRGLVGSISKNPVELVRLAGPYGPGLVSKFRPDLVAKFRHIYDDDSVTNYVYHCLAQHPSGEAAFVACSIPLSAWAKKPLIEDLPNLSEQIKTLFIYGTDTWMNKKSGYDVAKKLKGGAEYVEFPGGHHVYAERHEYVNNLVGLFGTSADKYKNYVKYFNRYIAEEEADINNKTRTADSNNQCTYIINLVTICK